MINHSNHKYHSFISDDYEPGCRNTMKQRLRRTLVRLYRYATLCVALFSTCISVAQDSGFLYKANITAASVTGFYALPLPPDVVAQSQPALTDIRIYNQQQQQAPYIIRKELPLFNEQSFVAFPIISKQKQADKQTHIVIENKATTPVTSLLLITANMDAQRMVDISGSNDGSNWYIIKEKVYLDHYFQPNEEELIQTISIPSSSYKYFQVTVIGEDILPFNIVKAGVYKNDYKQGKYTALPSPAIYQKDSSDKRSYIWLTFRQPYRIDQLELQLQGSPLYKRWLNIYNGARINTRLPYAVQLASNASHVFPLNGLQPSTDTLLLVINNQDDQPLHVRDVNAYQLTHTLVAYLQAGQQYQLYFGNDTLAAPVYDLVAFQDSILQRSIPTLAIGPIEEIHAKSQPAAIHKSSNKAWLWLAIAGVLSLLIFFSYRLLKDISKHKA